MICVCGHINKYHGHDLGSCCYVDCDCREFRENKTVEKTKFRVGDEVEWLGSKGEVMKVEGYVYVSFKKIPPFQFYLDGSLFEEQRPSLVLVNRPKKMVNKIITRYANVYPSGQSLTYETRELADESEGTAELNPRFKRIACVELKGEYEVEEE